MPATSYPPAEKYRTVRMLLMVTPEEKEQLRAMAAEQGISMSELIRRAVFEGQNGAGRRQQR